MHLVEMRGRLKGRGPANNLELLRCSQCGLKDGVKAESNKVLGFVWSARCLGVGNNKQGFWREEKGLAGINGIITMLMGLFRACQTKVTVPHLQQ
jgi:hypothetical protein